MTEPTRKTSKHRLLTGILSPLAAAVVLLAIWQAAAMLYGSPLLLPAPGAALRQFFAYLSAASFWQAFLGSVGRSLLGFLLSAAATALCAGLSAVCRPVRAFLTAVVGVLRALPTISVIVLLVLLTGSRLTLYSAVTAGADGVDRGLIEAAALDGASQWQAGLRVVCPLVLPAFFESAATCASLTLKLVVAAEVLAHTRVSLGLMMQQAQLLFETGRVLALTLAVIVGALLIEGALRLTGRLVVKRLLG